MEFPVRPLPRFVVVTAASFFVLSYAAPADAQGVLGRIRKKAADAVEKKAEEKVNNKIDELTQKMVDNSFSALFGDSVGATANDPGSGAAGGSRGIPFSFGNAATESSYSFDVVSTMEVESVARNGKSSGTAIIKMHFNSNAQYTGTSISSPDAKRSDADVFVVLDAKNQSMVMLMASDKSKFSMAYDWKEAKKFAGSAAASSGEAVNWDTVSVWKAYSKIGTRTIAGYSADGYRSESPDATVEIWVSRDRRLAIGNMMGANSSLKQMKGRVPTDYPQGMMLEMTSTNANSGEKVTMKVTKIDTNAKVTYSMSDYPKMEMEKK